MKENFRDLTLSLLSDNFGSRRQPWDKKRRKRKSAIGSCPEKN